MSVRACVRACVHAYVRAIVYVNVSGAMTSGVHQWKKNNAFIFFVKVHLVESPIIIVTGCQINSCSHTRAVPNNCSDLHENKYILAKGKMTADDDCDNDDNDI